MSDTRNNGHEFLGNEAGYWCFYEFPNGRQCGLDRDHAFHVVTPPKPLEYDSAEPSIESVMGILEIECQKCSYPDVFGECEEDHSSTPRVPAPIDTAEPQEATGTSCEVFIPLGSPGISWERPAHGTRPDIVGVRYLEDGSTEYLMHNEALCDPYYVGRSPDVAQGERCEHGVWAADHCWQCGPASTNATKPVPKPAPQAEGFEEAWTTYAESKSIWPNGKEHARSIWSAAQAPLLQKIAELEKKLEDYRLTFRAIEREAKRKEARIAELESAQPKAEKKYESKDLADYKIVAQNRIEEAREFVDSDELTHVLYRDAYWPVVDVVADALRMQDLLDQPKAEKVEER